MKSTMKNAREKAQTKAGRPSKINQETVRKLEMTASLDCTISEMCFYADISRDTYYRWMKENKELSDRLTALRTAPILKARQEVINGLTGNPEFALKYLERKLPNEFGIKHKEGLQIQQITTLGNLVGDGDNGNNPYLKMSEEELLKEFNRRKRLWFGKNKDKEEAGGVIDR